MAEQAALTATVRARLDEFERDMRKAEDIIGNAIDKMERELGVKLDVGKRMEESLQQAQPRLRSATIAIGNLMSQAIIQGLKLAQKALDDFVEQFKQIQTAAQLTGISIERIATMTKAIGSQGVPQALEQVATLLDRARRGEENALVKLLAENKQSIAGIRDAADAWERVARIIATARNQIQAREIAKSVGIDQETADRLFELGRGFDAAVESARPFGERLAEISEKARQFEDALNKLWKALTEIAKALAQNLAAVLAPAIELLATALDLLATKGAAFWETFGVTNLAGLEKVQTAAKLIRELADALKALSGETAAGGGAPLRITVGPGAGGGPREREGPFSRPIPLTRPTGAGAEGRDPFERELDRIRKSIALHEAEANTIGQTAEARERARTVAVLEEAAIRANTAAGLENTAVTAQQREQINQMADAMEKVIKRQSQLQFIASEMRNLAGLMSSAIEEMVFQGKKLDEVLRNIAQRLASRALQQALERLLVTAGTSLFGGGGFGFNPATAFSFGRQAGGHVSAGRSYLVGESGPELFTPTQAGQVIPNNALPTMGGVVINQTYDARGADPAAIRRLELIIAEDRRALPGRVMASITDARRRSAGR